MVATSVASASEFQRAKSFWQTRATRSHSQTKDSAAPPPAFSKQRSSSISNATEPEHDSDSESTASSSSSSLDTTRVDASTKSTDAASSFAKRIAPFTNTTTYDAIPTAFASTATTTPVAVRRGVGTSARAASAPNDFRPSIVSARPAAAASAPSDSPTTPAPDHTMPPTPSPSIAPAPTRVTVPSTTTSSVGASATAATTVAHSVFKTLSEHKLFGAAKATAAGAASMRSLSFASLSSSWKTSNSSSSSSSGSSPPKSASPSAAAQNAKRNVHNPSQCSSKTLSKPPQRSAVSTGSPYGELVVAEILAAKDLGGNGADDGTQNDPFVVVQFGATTKATRVVSAARHSVFNERFVFWVPSSPTLETQVVSVTVRTKTTVDEQIGEVHLTLAIPVNEAFDDWYPLVREDGSKHGSIRVGVRRMVLTSPSLLVTAKALAAQTCSLTDADLHTHGTTIPELWRGFTDAQSLVAAADENTSKLIRQTDVLASKLNHFSRRFIGIELTSSSGDSSSRRDVF